MKYLVKIGCDTEVHEMIMDSKSDAGAFIIDYLAVSDVTDPNFRVLESRCDREDPEIFVRTSNGMVHAYPCTVN